MRDPDPTIGQRPAYRGKGWLILAGNITRFALHVAAAVALMITLMVVAPYAAGRWWTKGVQDAWGESTCYGEDGE
jgi:hypothetical protein